MTDFFNSDIFYYVMIALFAGYSVYLFVQAFKLLRGNYIAKKKYKEQHNSTDYTEYKKFWVWVLLYGAFIAYCLYSAFTLNPEIKDARWYWMAFLFVGLILLAQMVGAIVKRSCIIGQDGFVYEDAYIPWRNVLNMEAKRKGIQRIVEVLGPNNKKLIFPADLGREIHNAYENYRKDRKEKKEVAKRK